MKPTILKISILLVILYAGYYFIISKNNTSSSTPTYTTARSSVENLVSTVTGSGSVTASNASTITTATSGVVKKLYVKNGDMVKTGDLLAEIDLDLLSKQKYAQASATYQSAKNSLASAQGNLYTQQASLFAANQKLINDAVARGLSKDDPTYIQQNATWLASEASYKNQQASIVQSNTALSAAYLTYQQASPYIYAPISGKLTGLSLQPGYVIASQSSTTSTASSTKIGSIVTSGSPYLQISLTEIDVVKVKIGQLATITFDSLPGKTFTGKVASIDTQGSVSSNVTTYATYLTLDLPPENIFANMAITANIIVATKDNVLTVPSSAIVTQVGSSNVRILQNNNLSFIPVTTGLVAGGKTEILTGLTEGQEVVTAVITPTSAATTGQSVFGGQLGGNRQIRPN